MIREKEKNWKDASGEERSKLHEEYFAGDIQSPESMETIKRSRI